MKPSLLKKISNENLVREFGMKAFKLWSFKPNEKNDKEYLKFKQELLRRLNKNDKP